MGTKKDIAQAFKERLSTYQATPDDTVWKQLEVSLNSKKKKKRIVPLWFYMASTTGIVIVLLLWFHKESNFSIVESKTDSEILDFNVKNKDSVQIYSKNNAYSDSEKSENSVNPGNPHNADNGENSENSENANNKSDVIYDNKSSTNEMSSRTTSKHHKDDIEKQSRKKSETKTYEDKKLYSKRKKSDHSQSENKATNKQDKINSEIPLKNEAVSTPKGSNENEKDSLLTKEKEGMENSDQSKIIELVKILNDSLKDLIETSSDKTTESLEAKTETNDSIKLPKNKKWSVFPNASIIYYDGFGSTFSNHVSLNYGLFLTYLPYNKVNFRLGVNKLELKQTVNSSTNSETEQKVSYLEFPIEIKYAIIDKKIRVSSIGGFSYLILNQATLTRTIENAVLINDNTSHFRKSTLSLNAGLQIQTKLFHQFYFNFEPVFKYHFAPYSANIDYNPFTISISAGIEYKF